jgi:hypothetical protein
MSRADVTTVEVAGTPMQSRACTGIPDRYQQYPCDILVILYIMVMRLSSAGSEPGHRGRPSPCIRDLGTPSKSLWEH